jgi:hypothetical protein
MNTEGLAQLCFVSDVCPLKQCYGSEKFIPDPDFYPSRIPGLVSQISDPGSRILDLGSRIPDLGTQISDLGFRISDPGYNNNKRGGRGKNRCLLGTFLWSKTQQIENISFFNRYLQKQNFLSIDKEFKKYLLNKFSLSSQKYRLVIRGPGSGTKENQDPQHCLPAYPRLSFICNGRGWAELFRRVLRLYRVLSPGLRHDHRLLSL